MIWHKPLVLLGLLAAFGNAAPLAPLKGDSQDIDNSTTQHLDKRINSHVTYVYRSDSRSPKELLKARGFHTKGHTKGKTEDLSLYNHCKGASNGASRDNDGYVSTTSKYSVAERWTEKHNGGNGYVYKIAVDEGLIDVQATLKHHSPFPNEYEFAGIQLIPWPQVMGWYQYSMTKSGMVKYPYAYNPDYAKQIYDGLEHGGAQYPLAGFPKHHKAWNELPWARYAACKVKSASKRAEEIFANQSPSGLDVEAPGATAVPATNSLEARARSRGPRTSRKRPSAAGKRKRPAKKPSKKGKKKPAKKPTTGTKKCTPAMKKAGKCKATTAQKCTPAMKKAGKCPATCTAAEKKANGGKCPTCTAAEKKKNGGKCPAKKGDCGPAVSNKARYQEYLKAVKAKKGGKKMHWSEGSTSTGTKGGKGGKTHG